MFNTNINLLVIYEKSTVKYLLFSSILSHPLKQKPIVYSESQGDRETQAAVSALPLPSCLIWELLSRPPFPLLTFHLELILPVLPKGTKLPAIKGVYKFKREISIRDQ